MPYKNNYNKTILISVVGEGDLEKAVNDILVDAGEYVDLMKLKGDRFFSHHVSKGNKGLYEVIGVYQTTM